MELFTVDQEYGKDSNENPLDWLDNQKLIDSYQEHEWVWGYKYKPKRPSALEFPSFVIDTALHTFNLKNGLSTPGDEHSEGRNLSREHNEFEPK